MTYDLLYTFKNYFKDNKVVLDTYKMENGVYFLAKEDDTIEKLVVEKGEPDNSELYEYLKEKEFFSKCFISNKVLNTECKVTNYKTKKKIYSNNIYTLFFRNDNCAGFTNNLEDKAMPNDLFEEVIKKYYEALKNLGNNEKEKNLIQERYSDEEINVYKEKMIKLFRQISKVFTEEDKAKKSNWVKIFIDQSNNEYERVGNIYNRARLFNNNDYNVEYDNNIFGANNYNFGCNSNKPFLELRTTPFKVGSRISIDDIEIMSKIYIWLCNNSRNESVLKLPVDWNFKGIPKNEQNISNKDLFILKVNVNNKVAKIEDFDYKSKFNTEIRPFTCRDYMRHKDNDYVISNINELEEYTNKTWYLNNQPKANWKQELMQKYSQTFFYLFQREERNVFLQNLDNIASEIVKKTLVVDLNFGNTNNSKKASLTST